MVRGAVILSMLLLSALTCCAAEPVTPHISGVTLGTFNGTLTLSQYDTEANLFVVHAKPSGGNWAPVFEAAAVYLSASTYFQGLQPNTQYELKIETRRSGETGLFSNVVTGTTTSIPRRR